MIREDDEDSKCDPPEPDNVQGTKFHDLVRSEVEQQLQERLDREEALTRIPYNLDDDTVSCSRRKATDFPQNARVELPDAVKKTEESEILQRSNLILETYSEYKKSNCNSKGDQRSNLSHKQRLGLQSLKKKVKEKSIIVCKTDKSGKLAVVSPEIYKELGQVHIKDDKPIEYKDAKKIQ